MTELTWILDPTSGTLTVEGLTVAKATMLVDDLLPAAREINCAQPLASAPLPGVSPVSGPMLRVHRIYHGSVVEGPGRRSVLQVQGCPIGCPFCNSAATHDPDAGLLLSIPDVVSALLDPSGEPRDGVTILGGEAFFQPVELLAILRELKDRSVHTVVYSGYTLQALARRREPEVRAALNLTDLLIDGPYVAILSEGAGEWRGSRNQQLIQRPGRVLDALDSRPKLT